MDADPFASNEGFADFQGDEQQNEGAASQPMFNEEGNGEDTNYAQQQEDDDAQADDGANNAGNDEDDYAEQREEQQQQEEEEEEEDPFQQAKTSSANAPAEQPDDSALREFQKAFLQVCLKKDDEEAAQKKELLAAGRAELEAFNSERTANRKTIAAANREQEKSLLADIDAALKSDNSWARVVSLVDLSTDPENKSDTTRFRNLLIHLKGNSGSSSSETTKASASAPASKKR